MKVTIFPDGDKNCTVTVTGYCESDFLEKVIDTSQLKGRPRTIRLSSVYFLIKEKAWIDLFWDSALEQLIFPMESRGAFRFDQGIRPPEGWGGAIYMFLHVDQKGVSRPFCFSLDFDK